MKIPVIPRTLGLLLLTLCLCLCTLVSSVVFAFPTHSSPSAETLEPGQVSFQPYPGSNPLNKLSFLMNSLSVGLWNGFEMGVVPVLWNSTSDLSTKNFNWKLRLFRSPQWTVAVGTEHIFSDPKNKSSFDGIRIDQLALSFEFRPQNQRLQYRYNFATSQMVVKNLLYWSGQRTDLYVSGGTDHYFDVAYAASNTNFWVLGLTYNHQLFAGLATREEDPAAPGVGLSHGWRFKSSLLSGFSLGFHVRKFSGNQILVSLLF